MSPVTATIPLPKRKLRLYAGIAGVFVLLGSLYVWVAYRSAARAARDNLNNWIGFAREQVIRSVETRFGDMRLLLLRHGVVGPNRPGEGTPVDREWLISLLRGFDAAQPQYRFHLIDSNGALYDSRGGSQGRVVGPAAMEESAAAGRALTAFLDAGTGKRVAAEIVPLYDGADRFLVRVSDLDRYAESVLRDTTLPGDYLALYDVDRNQTAGIARTKAGESESVRRELARRTADFYNIGGGREITQAGWLPNFYVHVLLDRREGWVLSAYIRSDVIVPAFNEMLAFSLAFSSLAFLFIAAIMTLDIRSERTKRREIDKAGSHDTLTSLYNGNGLSAAMKRHFRDRAEKGQCLIAADIVAFRRINGMFGHPIGDRVLRVTGSVLKKHYRFGARVGKDLFLCVADYADGVVDGLERRLREAIEQELGKEYLQMVAFKFGVYPFDDRFNVFNDAYDACILALEAAKNNVAANSVVYDREIQREAELQKKIEMNMLHALSKEEFAVFIQPKYSAGANGCGGGEALVRWRSEDSGVITPDKFIPLFERNGFIVELDFYMLASVFDMLQREIACGLTPHPISINQSRVTITFPNYLERVRKLVGRFKVPGNLLELELTESFLVGDYNRIVKLMHEIKELGFRVAIDDFGSGYSSLNTLRDLPVDVLKIDKGFLRESDTSERSKTIIRNIINLSWDLGIEVVCEGVETRDQFEFLTRSGCAFIQGYYFAKPMPAADFEAKYLDWPDPARQPETMDAEARRRSSTSIVPYRAAP